MYKSVPKVAKHESVLEKLEIRKQSESYFECHKKQKKTSQNVLKKVCLLNQQVLAIAV